MKNYSKLTPEGTRDVLFEASEAQSHIERSLRTFFYCRGFREVRTPGIEYFDVFGSAGIKSIYGMSGAESIPLIGKAIMALGDDVSADYWGATEGNAKSPLYQLLDMAKMRPDGVWYVD